MGRNVDAGARRVGAGGVGESRGVGWAAESLRCAVCASGPGHVSIEEVTDQTGKAAARGRAGARSGLRCRVAGGGAGVLTIRRRSRYASSWR